MMQQMLLSFGGSATTSAVTPNHSVQFDGDGDYIESTTDSNVPVGNGDFTLEFWVRFADASPDLDTISETRSSTGASDGFLVGRFHTSGHEDQMEVYSAGTYTGVASGALSNNTWYHIAVVRNSGTLRMYVNGQDTGTTYSDSNNYSNDDIRIGANVATQHYLDGNVADFRLTTSALYTSNFAPPTDQLDPVTGTAILCCQDATGAGTATTGDNFTTVGNVTAVAVAPTTSGGGNQVYVDDVFSTWLYNGNASEQVIPNGIDLANEGGLVWMKERSGQGFDDHVLVDTVRGRFKGLKTNSGNQETTSSDPYPYIASFDTTGFTSGYNNSNNYDPAEYVSWTFRKQPGFFDIVIWNGDNSATRSIPHSLGSEPGMVIVKRTNGTNNWFTYHRSLPDPLTRWVSLNRTQEAIQANVGSNMWGAMTSTDIGITNYFGLNTTGQSYIAYIFAHDDQRFGQNGNEAIIKCGTYTGLGTSGDADSNEQDLGFEPQFLMVKNISRDSDPYTGWLMFDSSRGVSYGKGTTSPNGDDQYLYANSDSTEQTDAVVNFTPTGFSLTNSGYNLNYSTQAGVGGTSDEYIYMAIRRPNKPPTYGTDVFAMEDPGSPVNPDGLAFTAGFTVDMALFKERSNTDSFINMSRVLGNQNWLKTQHTDAENNTISAGTWDHSTGWFSTASANMSWMFKRAPGFFEISSYTGSGGAHDTAPKTVNHQLGVVPELIIIKNRSSAKHWKVWSSAIGAQKLGTLNTDASWGSDSQIKNVTSTTFDVGLDGAFTHTNASTDLHIAYLFASVPGVSKIGTYTGVSSNGAALVTLGFTPRFIMVKSINASGEWIIYDSVRDLKIGSTSAKALSLSEGTTNNANETTIGSVDGLRATLTGFVINGFGASSDVNVYNEEFFYFAIA